MMPVAIQPRGKPEARVVIRAALHSDLGYLIALGYEFPCVALAAGAFGVRVAGPLA